MKLKKAVTVFVKLPIAGIVKTRLAKEIGNNVAASFYKVCAEHIIKSLSAFKKKEFDIFIFYSEDNNLEAVKDWIGNDYSYFPQKGENLGEKMQNAFKQIFKLQYDKVVIIGTDIPDINSSVLKNAFSSLDDHECVLGPANDGGYYLVGFRSQVRDIFSDINWDSDSVLKSTIENLKKQSVMFNLLDELIDIDTVEDLKNWLNNSKGGNTQFVKSFLESSGISI